MIILDTNVVSEPMKPDGDRGVQTWLDEHSHTDGAMSFMFIIRMSSLRLMTRLVTFA